MITVLAIIGGAACLVGGVTLGVRLLLGGLKPGDLP